MKLTVPSCPSKKSNYFAGEMRSLLSIFILLSAAALGSGSEPTQPKFPNDFEASITITANLLPPDVEYPPRTKRVNVQYSLEERKAKVEITEGYEAGKAYLRDYANELDYMIKGGEYPACQRSHLGEDIAEVSLPRMVHLGVEVVEGAELQHWVRDSGVERVHVYVDADGLPRRLVTQDVVGGEGQGEAVTTMTYVVTAIEEVKQWRNNAWELGSGGEGEVVWVKGRGLGEAEGGQGVYCENFQGGFPYIHLFHWYLRI